MDGTRVNTNPTEPAKCLALKDSRDTGLKQ